jgi:carboxyl-terminal processing protease
MQRQTPTRAAAVVSAAYVAGLMAGAATGTAAVARAQDPYVDLDRFARILTVIEQDYVEPLPTSRLIDAAIDGMVGALDEHSRWLSADQARSLREDTAGETTGIGLDVRVSQGEVVVQRVAPGSPAARDGLAPGDRILAVDGTPLDGLDGDSIRDQLVGQRGQPAVLKIVREGWDAPREVTTVRDRIEIPAVEGALLTGDIAYVRLVQFQLGAGRDLEAEIHRLEGRSSSGHLRGLVIDLRDNPGGLLSEAVAVTDLFLDSGPIVSVRGRSELNAADGSVRDKFEATPGGWPDLPLVAVVNDMSASAAEIFAAALQDTKRAPLVGTTTYGKGSVQQLYRSPDGSALKLTVGLYYTASGAPVAAHEGRHPDVWVDWPGDPTPLAALEKEIAADGLAPETRDRLLSLASKVKDEEAPQREIPWDQPVETRLKGDPQIQKAIEVVKGTAGG